MPKISRMVQIAAEVWNITPQDITGPSLAHAHSNPRMAVYAVAVRHGYSSGQVARCMGGRDGSTVRAGAIRVRQMMQSDSAFAWDFEQFERLVDRAG